MPGYDATGFGNLLTPWRVRADLTQEGIAERVGVSPRRRKPAAWPRRKAPARDDQCAGRRTGTERAEPGGHSVSIVPPRAGPGLGNLAGFSGSVISIIRSAAARENGRPPRAAILPRESSSSDGQ